MNAHSMKCDLTSNINLSGFPVVPPVNPTYELILLLCKILSARSYQNCSFIKNRQFLYMPDVLQITWGKTC